MDNSGTKEKSAATRQEEIDTLTAFFKRFNPAPLVNPFEVLHDDRDRTSRPGKNSVLNTSGSATRRGSKSRLTKPNSAANVKQFLAENPDFIPRLFTDRKAALWEISNALCGTQTHERTDKNTAQYIGRHYGTRQKDRRPKRHGPKKPD